MKNYINVTNSYQTLGRSGIQRVVKELVSRRYADEDVEIIVYNQGEFYCLNGEREFDKYLAGKSFKPTKKLPLDQFKPGDVFLDLDASWGDSYDCGTLFRYLKRQGVIVVKMHFDAVPILFSEYTHPNTVFNFLENFSASLKYSDYWICISKVVQRDLLKIAKSIDMGRPVSDVMPLGADFEARSHSGKKADSDLDQYGKYVLVVGTIEPRKNHDLVLDVFDRLLEKRTDLNFILVGKQGWNIRNTIARIVNHEKFNRQLFWFNDLDDVAVKRFYHSAYISLNISHYEGYGLPVIESLAMGCVTICTEGGAMEEASKGTAFCVNPSVESVVSAIESLRSSGKYLEYQKKAAQFSLPCWADSADYLKAYLSEIATSDGMDLPIRQAVYISIRPQELRASIESIISNADFIREVIVLTADHLAAEMQAVFDELSISVLLIKESDVFQAKELPEDHQARNTFLRRKLYSMPLVQNNFIALDDDNLFIEKATESDFKVGDRHIAYYFYDKGSNWMGAYSGTTSFDRGIWRTARYLNSCGYDTKLYNVHAPQVINKAICSMILERVKDLQLDEWSTYFNIAKHLYPGNYRDVAYRTIGWPDEKFQWLPTISPVRIVFQNSYAGEQNLALASSIERYGVTEKYSVEMRSKLDIVHSIVPLTPTLTINADGIHFNFTTIQAKRNTCIAIKVISYLKAFELNFDNTLLKAKFNYDTIPRFLIIPEAAYNHAKDGRLALQFSLKVEDQDYEANCIIDELP